MTHREYTVDTSTPWCLSPEHFRLCMLVNLYAAASSNTLLSSFASCSVLTLILYCVGSCPSNPKNAFTVFSRLLFNPLYTKKLTATLPFASLRASSRCLLVDESYLTLAMHTPRSFQDFVDMSNFQIFERTVKRVDSDSSPSPSPSRPEDVILLGSSVVSVSVSLSEFVVAAGDADAAIGAQKLNPVLSGEAASVAALLGVSEHVSIS